MAEGVGDRALGAGRLIGGPRRVPGIGPTVRMTRRPEPKETAMSADSWIPPLIGGLVIVALLGPAVITALKGKSGMVLLGLLLHPIWWFGAAMLAKPDSFWAGRFYDERKMARARRRFPAFSVTAPPTRDDRMW